MDKKVENPSVPAEPIPAAEETPAAGAGRKIQMPEMLAVAPSPHIKTPDTTATVMFDVILALLPAFIWGTYVFGTRALAVAAVSIAACIGFEAAAQFLLHRPVTISDLSAVVTGLLLAMNLPVSVPLWMPVVGAFFAIVVVKQIFGGIGKNFVNPALAARVFLFSWASEMTAFSADGERVTSLAPVLAEGDIVASATPLASLKTGSLPPETIFDMFLGNHAGCTGEVMSLLLLAGGFSCLSSESSPGIFPWRISARLPR